MPMETQEIRESVLESLELDKEGIELKLNRIVVSYSKLECVYNFELVIIGENARKQRGFKCGDNSLITELFKGQFPKTYLDHNIRSSSIEDGLEWSEFYGFLARKDLPEI